MSTLLLRLCAVVLVLLSFPGCRAREEAKNNKSEELAPATFVKNEACAECHTKQQQEWLGSDHDRAMDVATEQTVLGDFNNAQFTAHGVTSTFYKKDGKFVVQTDGPDGKLKDYHIAYVFGFKPLQQYMVEFPNGRIQLPDIAWDTRPRSQGGQRWFDLHPNEKITPRHAFHWTGRFLNWNYMCAECHSTNLQKNYDLETNTFKTTWSDIDVGCQACHGPGSKHIAWARSGDKNKKRDNQKDSYEEMGLEVNLKAKDLHVQIEHCARCHSRRNGLRKDYRYGQPYMDYYVPQVLTEPLYYPDGQILDEVYVYGSFLQSKMYQRGVRCTDCHNPHTAKLKAEGNALCIQCHALAPARQFKDVANKDYDSPGHHFHKPGSPGAQCVGCHMPATKYMIVDPRRDHKFQIPRPDLTVKLGVPNSCNRCHKDKSPRWAADKVKEWYPTLEEKRRSETLVAETFASGQKGKPEAQAKLIEIATDGSRAAIIRATALNILSRYRSQQALDATAAFLKDAEPLVRYEAVRGVSALITRNMENSYQKTKVALLAPLLSDPRRAVRSEVGRALTEVPAELLDGQTRKDFESALQEYRARQIAIADRPEAHLNLGLIYQNLKQNELAESSYKTAIRLANDFIPARFNLANLYNATGRNREAEEQFRQIIQFEPDNGEAYYSLGLLLAEMKKLKEAADALGKAARLTPGRARVHYNYGLALQQLGQRVGAETALLRAYQLDSEDPSILQALAVHYLQGRRWDQAAVYAKKLARMYPNEPGPRRMLEEIQRQAKR
jgi:predicted CXXCH cytochrome family protein